MRTLTLPILALALYGPSHAVYGATVTWTDIDPMDAIGLGCIDGGGPDDPFPSAGKGDRAPAFCLPAPCERALSREELNYKVLGRPVTDEEYGTYYARYAEACVAEAVNPDAPASDVTAFWPDTIRAIEAINPAPFVLSGGTAGSGPIFGGGLSTGPGGSGGGGSSGGGGGGVIVPGGGTGGGTGGGGGTSGGGGSGGGETPPVVPLPAALWGYLAAIITFIFITKQKGPQT